MLLGGARTPLAPPPRGGEGTLIQLPSAFAGGRGTQLSLWFLAERVVIVQQFSVLPGCHFPDLLTRKKRPLGVLFVCAHWHFWAVGFSSTQSRIFETRKKTRELTTVVLLRDRGPWPDCYLLSSFQSPCAYFPVVFRVLSCTKQEEKENVMIHFCGSRSPVLFVRFLFFLHAYVLMNLSPKCLPSADYAPALQRCLPWGMWRVPQPCP